MTVWAYVYCIIIGFYLATKEVIMKTSKKVQKRLEARLRGHSEAVEIANRRSAGGARGLKQPGSRNPRKG